MSLLDDLLDKKKPAPESVEVDLPDGNKLAFKILEGYSEIVELRSGAQRFVESVIDKDNRPKALPAEWQPHFVAHADTLRWVYILDRLCVDHQGQLSWLKLARHAGYLFESIRDQVAMAQIRYSYEADTQEIERLGEALGATDFGKPSSPSPATSTTNIPTN